VVDRIEYLESVAEDLAIEAAAKGMVSGTLSEWPMLRQALRHYYIKGVNISDKTPADELGRICRHIQRHGPDRVID
jgi:hypothetical protein